MKKGSKAIGADMESVLDIKYKSKCIESSHFLFLNKVCDYKLIQALTKFFSEGKWRLTF